jgi:hypothetical protein
VRLALVQPVEFHDADHLGDALADVLAGQPFLLQPERDVLLDRHVREQRVGLEHHVHRPLVGRHALHVLAVDEDAPVGRHLEPGEHAQECRLAAARAAQQAEDFAAVDVQRNIVDRDELSELLRDVVDAYVGLGPRILPGSLVRLLVVGPGRHTRAAVTCLS